MGHLLNYLKIRTQKVDCCIIVGRKRGGEEKGGKRRGGKEKGMKGEGDEKGRGGKGEGKEKGRVRGGKGEEKGRKRGGEGEEKGRKRGGKGGGGADSYVKQIGGKRAEPQQIVAQRLLSCLQYPVPNVSRLQRI